jgi:tetratricopeptide (TPR) repeat protein
MTSDLPGAWKILEAGDPPAAVSSLRYAADGLPVGGLGEFTAAVARAMGLDSLAAASEALRDEPESAQACYDFGFECLEAGAPHLAVPALRAARRLAPAAAPALWELVSALEDQERHADAVRELRAWEDGLPDWPGGYLLAYNALGSGDVDTAREVLERLSTPDDDSWDLAHDRITRMVERAGAARSAGPMDEEDLRGWQFALTGAVLGHVSPYGLDSGTNGRYAYLGDMYGPCRSGLRDLAAVLKATGQRPDAVMPLPDRSSRVLGLAAARLLDLPVVPVDPERSDALVVAYDLNDTDPERLRALVPRAPGQILFERASCWTSPPGVAADVVSLLHQQTVPPWGETVRVVGEGVERVPADGAPDEELAERILAAETEEQDPALVPFAEEVAGHWARGPRLPVATSGPVRSSRFE